MASSSTLDLAMGPGALLPRSAVPYASFAPGRGRSASGTRSRNLALSASSSNGAAVPSLTTDSEKKGPVIMEIPLDQIRRPLMRTRANDPVKVQELMDSIRVIGLQIDVLEVDGVYYGGLLWMPPLRGSPAPWSPNHPLQSSPWDKGNTEARAPSFSLDSIFELLDALNFSLLFQAPYAMSWILFSYKVICVSRAKTEASMVFSSSRL
ncbi:Sulfiredoxin, chloroplastic/mitochondrial [Zea mays]|uniref:Sulfiredoxin, chloroplastic/mitochondrial n=1 Tax=Zea mays TaxID=4577 RepID=A0A3L6DCG1_MAIZE|nr:Sulfiredoxin, chloroplastic/mitochondrial [Zea mays]